MVDPITILTAEIEDPDGLILTFSDGTTAAFLVEEMLDLRPYRESMEDAQETADADARPHLSLVRSFVLN